MNYAATFHTHLSAMLTCRRLKAEGVSARQAPVPRRLSSSCGTCVLYEAEDPMLPAMDRDAEAVWLRQGEDFQLVWQAPQAE